MIGLFLSCVIFYYLLFPMLGRRLSLHPFFFQTLELFPSFFPTLGKLLLCPLFQNLRCLFREFLNQPLKEFHLIFPGCPANLCQQLKAEAFRFIPNLKRRAFLKQKPCIYKHPKRFSWRNYDKFLPLYLCHHAKLPKTVATLNRSLYGTFSFARLLSEQMVD
jgi:hypothetical protein